MTMNFVYASYFVLFSVIVFSIFSTEYASADHLEKTVSIPEETSVPGCEETNACYIPYDVTIDVGGEITWINDDNTAHTVTSGNPIDGPDGIFDSSIMYPGDEYSVSFTNHNPGKYDYYCMIHPWMSGFVTIQSEDTEPVSEKIKESAEDVGKTVEKTGSELGNTLEKTGELVGEKVETGEKVSSEIKEGGQEIQQEISEAAQETSEAGGCLIATATYGSELAPQVQQLRELRDSTLLHTETGTSFMKSFNSFYYSFSPYIADYERENPVFKETVKLAITPLISSLSILNYVDIDSEAGVLGYGISLIILNLGMYVGIPAFAIISMKKRL